jgi:hypothetical protein
MVEGAETELFKDQFPQWEKPKRLSVTNFEDARKSIHSVDPVVAIIVV